MNQHTAPSLHQRAPTPPRHFLKRATQYLLNHKMTHCSTYTTPDLPPTLAARLAVCKGIHSNKYRPLKYTYPTPNIPLRLLPNHNPYDQMPYSFHTPYIVLPPFSSSSSSTQCTALQLPNPMQCSTHSWASSCIYAHFLFGNIR